MYGAAIGREVRKTVKDIAIILACWAISFLFNGIEAGLFAIDPVRLRYHVKLKSRPAVRLSSLLKKPVRLLVTVLLVTNFADILALLLLTRLLVSKFHAAGFFLAALVALPIWLFFLVIVPKALFRRFPFRALAALAGLLQGVTRLLSPLLALGGWIAQRILPPRAKAYGQFFAAREEFKQVTARSEREGSLTATERGMIHNVVDFQNVTARDVMTPAPKTPTLKPDLSVSEVLSIGRSAGTDRFPIVNAHGDAIGLVNILDILLDKDEPQSLTPYVRRIVTVAENEPADRVVRRLRAARLSLAAVVDLKQKLIGFVSSEDLIARLVRA